MEVVFGVVRIRCVWARALPFGRIICWTMFSTGHLSCASILRHDVLCCLFYFCISFFVPRHNHPRFVDVMLRITKGGSKTTDMLVVRVYSFFACITEEEKAALGRSTFIQCSAEHVNLPQLFMGALFLASSCPAVSGCCGMLAKMPVFPSMSSTGNRDEVIFQRMRTLAEINGRRESIFQVHCHVWQSPSLGPVHRARPSQHKGQLSPGCRRGMPIQRDNLACDRSHKHGMVAPGRQKETHNRKRPTANSAKHLHHAPRARRYASVRQRR